jgi:hypothetical protein
MKSRRLLWTWYVTRMGRQGIRAEYWLRIHLEKVFFEDKDRDGRITLRLTLWR